MWPSVSPLLPHAKAWKGFCIAWCTVLMPQLHQLLSGMKAQLFASLGCAAASPPLVTLLTLAALTSAITTAQRPIVALNLETSATAELFSLSPPATLGLGTLSSAPASSSQGFLQSFKTYKHPAATRSLFGCLRDPALESA